MTSFCIDLGRSRIRAKLTPASENSLFYEEERTLADRRDAATDITLIIRACEWTKSHMEPNDIEIVAVGMAGFNDELELLIRNEIQKRISHARIMVSSDAKAAYASVFTHQELGGLLILGSGSVLQTFQHGTWKKYGGFGFRIGDPCSAYAFSRMLIRRLILEKQTNIQSNFLKLWKDVYSTEPSEFDNQVVFKGLNLVPALLSEAESGSKVAIDMVEDQIDILKALLEAIPEEVSTLALFGGLISNTWLKKRIEREMDRIGKQSSRREVDPLVGALNLIQNATHWNI